MNPEPLRFFSGLCPYLDCKERGPHRHFVCPECETLRYANPQCPVCRELLEILLNRGAVETRQKGGGYKDDNWDRLKASEVFYIQA